MSALDPALADIIIPLQTRRFALGLSQVDLDERIGVTVGQVAKWESGNRRPTAYLLSCWCEALGVRLQVVVPQSMVPSAP